MRKVVLWFYMSIFFSTSHGEIQDYFKKPPKIARPNQIENIDYIYLINLDKRKDRLDYSLKELSCYGIEPDRLSAVNGMELSQEAFEEVGIHFSSQMEGQKLALFSPGINNSKLCPIVLNPRAYGKCVYSIAMTPGAIGCSLSHLSILQDAYDSGYETIWVLEDDVKILVDPHFLSKEIEKLDCLVGKDGWDILYNDLDDFQEKTMVGDFWFMWRPDLGLKDQNIYKVRQVVSKDFIKIAMRARTHSMIIRRSGMKKILDFAKENHIYIPYDHEIALVKDIRLYMVRTPFVGFIESKSDIQK